MKYPCLKIAFLSSIASLVHAGDMGPIAVAPCSHAFVSAEGGYTWSQIDGFHLSFTEIFPGILSLGLDSTQSRKGGTGRVAAGLLKPLYDSFLVSGEIGYGYYGSTTMSFLDAFGTGLTLGTQNSIKLTQDGFDALAGIVYYRPNYDVFFKAGALIQNSRSKANTSETDVLLPVSTNNSAIFKGNNTQALPEIKLGASYHVLENLSIMASWTHAFGSTVQWKAAFTSLGTSYYTNVQNPTLDVAMLGLQYQFG